MPVMRDKVVVVTGANSGIGKATATALARKGAMVVMVCRDAERGEAARSDIRAQSDNPAVDLLVADLASQAAVRGLALHFTDHYPELHVLVNNAGVWRPRYEETPDGIETTLAVNHLAPFLLTNLLGDVLITSAPARVVNVSSMVHKWGDIRFDDLNRRQDWSPRGAYYQSKLAGVLFIHELARRLDGTGVTANLVHPGMVASNFARDMGGFRGLMARYLWRPFMKSPDKGAEAVVHVAASPEVEGVTGAYYTAAGRCPTAGASRDEAAARRLWEASAQLTGLTPDQEIG